MGAVTRRPEAERAAMNDGDDDGRDAAPLTAPEVELGPRRRDSRAVEGVAATDARAGGEAKAGLAFSDDSSD